MLVCVELNAEEACESVETSEELFSIESTSRRGWCSPPALSKGATIRYPNFEVTTLMTSKPWSPSTKRLVLIAIVSDSAKVE
jgi:hypothetical protein